MKPCSRGTVLHSLETLFSTGSVTGLSDRDLLDQFLAKQSPSAEAAFSSLLTRHAPLVWTVCRGALSDTHAAEDAFQATFLILVKKAATIRRRETLAPWLFGVARRVAVRARKRAARRESPSGEMTQMKASAQPDPDPSRREQLEALHQELDRLPERYRTVLVLCHLEGRTHAEAARLLCCPAATVSIRVVRARERLRARLAHRGLAFSAIAAPALHSESPFSALPAGLAESTTRAALCLAAGTSMTAGVVPAAVLQLTQGVLTTMRMHKLTITVTSLFVGLIVSGLGVFAMSGFKEQQPAPAPALAPKSEDDLAKARAKSADNLKRIALAMINSAMLKPEPTFPAAAILSKEGKPLLSWRVALLPYLDMAIGRDQHLLFEKFHLDEPWDSPQNKELIEQIPAIYAPLVKKDDPKGSTYYQVFSGPGALFEGRAGTRFADVFDGISNTLLVVEAAKPVPWTKPDDIPFDQAESKVNPLPMLGGQFDEGFHAIFADGGTSYLIKNTIAVATLRALITRAGGEVVAFNDIPATPAYGSVHQTPPPGTSATPKVAPAREK